MCCPLFCGWRFDRQAVRAVFSSHSLFVKPAIDTTARQTAGLSIPVLSAFCCLIFPCRSV